MKIDQTLPADELRELADAAEELARNPAWPNVLNVLQGMYGPRATFERIAAQARNREANLRDFGAFVIAQVAAHDAIVTAIDQPTALAKALRKRAGELDAALAEATKGSASPYGPDVEVTR